MNTGGTGGNKGKQEASFDPNMLGTVVDLLSSLNKASSDSDNNNVDENNNDGHEGKKKGGKDVGIDWETMLSFAGN